jgi:hypothetical protein
VFLLIFDFTFMNLVVWAASFRQLWKGQEITLIKAGIRKAVSERILWSGFGGRGTLPRSP